MFTVGLAVLALAGCGGGEKKVKLSGSGSSFVKPVMDKWIAEFTREKGGEINYQPQGSGAGVKQMTEKAVDFGCTDAFMKAEQLEAAEKEGGDVLHIPLVMGGIVPAYNLDVEKPLNFTGEVLADIFLGKIANWNDPRLQALNEGVKLPDKEIAVVTRGDSSGSTSIFTEFLSKSSPEWKKEVGTGTTVKWKKGTAESQTAGVAGAISKNPGSIGYVELYYALQNKIKYGAVRNRAGKFVLASTHSVSKAAEGVLKEIPEDLRYSLVDAPGEESYPISGTTWAVVYVKQSGDTGKHLAEFFGWILHHGGPLAEKMDYAPIPESLVKLIEPKLKTLAGK
jgi:phosphate transport system substrate-binding protein